MISVGHRSGLFDTMANLAPSTSAEVAEAAELDERYVREWLAAMTVSGGRFPLSPDGTRFSLPPARAACLTRDSAPEQPGPPLLSTLRFLVPSRIASSTAFRSRGRCALLGFSPVPRSDGRGQWADRAARPHRQDTSSGPWSASAARCWNRRDGYRMWARTRPGQNGSRLSSLSIRRPRLQSRSHRSCLQCGQETRSSECPASRWQTRRRWTMSTSST